MDNKNARGTKNVCKEKLYPQIYLDNRNNQKIRIHKLGEKCGCHNKHWRLIHRLTLRYIFLCPFMNEIFWMKSLILWIFYVLVIMKMYESEKYIHFRVIPYQYNLSYSSMYKYKPPNTRDLTLKYLGTFYPLTYIDITRFV